MGDFCASTILGLVVMRHGSDIRFIVVVVVVIVSKKRSFNTGYDTML